MGASAKHPRTMTKEWQEASEEYLKVRSLNLISSKFHYSTHIFDFANNLNRSKERSLSLDTRACWSKAKLVPRVNLTTTKNKSVQKKVVTYKHSPLVKYSVGAVCIKGGIKSAFTLAPATKLPLLY